jgi:Fe-S-cluster containining protein
MNTFEMDLTNLTNEKVEAIISDLRKSQLSLNLNIPYTADGLNYLWSKFKCTRCGKCCDGTIIGPRGEKFIRLIKSDLKRLKKHIKAKRLRRFCIDIGNQEQGLAFPCPFFIKEPRPACKIYHDRPDKCKSYPLETPLLTNLIKPPSITVDPYCEGACNLFRSLIVASANKFEEQITSMNKDTHIG